MGQPHLGTRFMTFIFISVYFLNGRQGYIFIFKIWSESLKYVLLGHALFIRHKAYIFRVIEL